MPNQVMQRIALLGAIGFILAACGAGAVGGPDPARSTLFKATMLDGGTLPKRVNVYGLIEPLYLSDALLVPMDLGRTTDTRIFDDRGGTGSGSGNGRDSTVSTGRMSDIRVFRDIRGVTQTDSVAVDVVRIGDVLYITRPHPDPSRSKTDTAVYENGVLLRKVQYWREVNERPPGQTITYTTVR